MQALEVPALRGRVNDLAGVLSDSTRVTLESALRSHEEATTHQVAVLVVRSLEGESLEDYSHRVASAWALGRKGKDNGVLLFIAVADRKLRIEVGYGLEGLLPDSRCGRIIREAIAPHFRSGDYDGGVRAGVDQILATLGGRGMPPPPPTSGGGGAGGEDPLLGALFAASILIALSLLGPSVDDREMARAVCGVSTVGWTGLFAFWSWQAALVTLLLHPLFFYLWRWFLGTWLGKALIRSLTSGSGRGYYGGGGGWSSGGDWGGGSWSGGGGFSGGGGSFGGGGASGSW